MEGFFHLCHLFSKQKGQGLQIVMCLVYEMIKQVEAACVVCGAVDASSVNAPPQPLLSSAPPVVFVPPPPPPNSASFSSASSSSSSSSSRDLSAPQTRVRYLAFVANLLCALPLDEEQPLHVVEKLNRFLNSQGHILQAAMNK